MNLLLFLAFLIAMLGAFSGFFKIKKNSGYEIEIRKKGASIVSGVLFLLAGLTALFLSF